MTFMEEIALAVDEYSNENLNPTREEAEAFLMAVGVLDEADLPSPERNSDNENSD